MSTRSRRKPGRRDPSTLARFPLTAAIYLAFGATAMAQDAPATPPAEGERAAATLDTITVTGQRLPLSSFPGAVDVVDGESLRDGQRRVNLSESLSRVPGFTVRDRGNFAQDLQVQSRGFGARSTFGIRGIRLVADGVDGKSVATAQAALRAAGAQVHLIAPRLGPVKPASGEPFEATGTLENSPPVLFDGVVLPDGDDGVKVLGGFIEVMDFISNQHRHGKTLLALGASKALIAQAGVSPTLASGEADPGIVIGAAAKAAPAVADFITALGRHRHPEREAGALAP